MRFAVKVTPTFRIWFNEQDLPLRPAIMMHIGLLEAHGPTLGRPYADTLKGLLGQHLEALKREDGEDEDRIR